VEAAEAVFAAAALAVLAALVAYAVLAAFTACSWRTLATPFVRAVAWQLQRKLQRMNGGTDALS